MFGSEKIGWSIVYLCILVCSPWKYHVFILNANEPFSRKYRKKTRNIAIFSKVSYLETHFFTYRTAFQESVIHVRFHTNKTKLPADVNCIIEITHRRDLFNNFTIQTHTRRNILFTFRLEHDILGFVDITRWSYSRRVEKSSPCRTPLFCINALNYFLFLLAEPYMQYINNPGTNVSPFKCI